MGQLVSSIENKKSKNGMNSRPRSQTHVGRARAVSILLDTKEGFHGRLPRPQVFRELFSFVMAVQLWYKYWLREQS
jgi:hypothetical protein